MFGQQLLSGFIQAEVGHKKPVLLLVVAVVLFGQLLKEHLTSMMKLMTLTIFVTDYTDDESDGQAN